MAYKKHRYNKLQAKIATAMKSHSHLHTERINEGSGSLNNLPKPADKNVPDGGAQTEKGGVTSAHIFTERDKQIDSMIADLQKYWPVVQKNRPDFEQFSRNNIY